MKFLEAIVAFYAGASAVSALSIPRDVTALAVRAADDISTIHASLFDSKALEKRKGGGGRGGGSSSSRLVLLDIFTENPTLRTRALDLRQRNPTFQGNLLCYGRSEDAVTLRQVGFCLLLSGSGFGF